MLSIIARLVAARPRAILITAGILVALGAGYGATAATQLSPAGYEVPGSEATRAAELLADEFDAGTANVVLLLTTAVTEGGSAPIDSGQSRQDAAAVAATLRSIDNVGEVVSYWETGAPQLRSATGDQALISARIIGDEDLVYDRVDEIRDAFDEPVGTLAVDVGGSGAVNLEVVEQSERDLLRAEMLVIPLTTIIMLIVFRSVVAALLPLIVSAIAVVGTAVVLRAMSEVTLVSIFALNLTTALGLGMGIDYSLLLISRWREEREAGAEPTGAVATAVTVAGRSIFFSGLTTAATLAALLLFDYPLLRSLALAGFVVVLLATLGALVVLPAAMVLLGERVEAWSIRRPEPKPITEGRWYRLTHAVMKRPGPVIVVTVLFLLWLGMPFLRADFGIPDDRVLPEDANSRVVADAVRADFDAREFATIAVVMPDGASVEVADQAAYATALSETTGVSRVETAAGAFSDGALLGPVPEPARFTSQDALWFSLVPSVEPVSAEGEAIVQAIRAADAPRDVLVGGEPARLVDNKAEIAAKIPWVLVWIAVVIFGLLYWSFGSILIPIKAILLNLLSLTASFGAIVWIFQDGRLSDLLRYTPTGLTDAQTPILMFCIAFGLSMDYEVFLLSRIKEEWDRSGDPRESVAVGLQRTGGIITAAAVLMAIVFLSFATGSVTFIQMVGLGLALSILVDALIVRALLVPAFMAVAGRWNWWSPFARHTAAPTEPSPTLTINLAPPHDTRGDSPQRVTT